MMLPLFFLCIIGTAYGRFSLPFLKFSKPAPVEILKAPEWSEEWLEDVPIDHFSYADSRTFAVRYFINTDSYSSGGPIFFYTGNEGALEAFAVNTGFMWDNAAEYKAAVVFAEHRFYGKTLPFGNDSFANVENLGYLSSEQALADFADVIVYLKNKRISGATHSPVVAFGGSYGGMLAAWMRIKYPHLICGSIAASAPVFWFENAGVDENSYARIVTRTFERSGCNIKAVSEALQSVTEISKSDEGLKYINSVLKLNADSQIVNQSDSVYLQNTIQDIMDNVAMVDYPYEANFLSKLPPWPVKEMCKPFAEQKSTDEERVKDLYSIFNVWFNTTGKVKEFCLRGDQCAPDDALGAMQGWTWQTCTEMVMPICRSGMPDDMFIKNCPFVVKDYRDFCVETYGSKGYKEVLMRPNWALENYGRIFPSATNIVFSNGLLDPWSAGGWKLDPGREGSLVSLIIEDGAHHYDLRHSHPNDTKAVIEARRVEKAEIRRWIKEAREVPSPQFKTFKRHQHRHHIGHRHHHLN